MTLEELMKPNKYGTTPILNIVGVGTITVTELGYCCQIHNTTPFYLDRVELVTRTLRNNRDDPLYMEKVAFTNERVGYALAHYNMYLQHLRLATPEERLFCTTVDGHDLTYYYFYQGTLYATEQPVRIMPNGTGWVSGMSHNTTELVPVTFYLEDILYRLDLQDEVP